MEEEIWKQCQDFPDYFVSNMGNIKSLKYNKEKILKQRFNRERNYYYIGIQSSEGQKTVLIHRLIGKAFLEPIEGKEEIDHIDKNTKNNRLSNLHWVDRSENLLNRSPPKRKNNTGEPYISFLKRDSIYKVSIKNQIKYFKRLEDAISFRNTILEQI